ncbi:MAG: peptidylprolyl isomerase [bacterium]|nr:peptidylprolyl isomerase [bacterium]
MRKDLGSSLWFAGLSTLLMVTLLFNVPVQALEGKIVARINGQPVYDWEITLAENEIKDELEQVDADMRRGLLLRYVIDTRLMALAGASAGLDNEQAFKRRIDYNRNQAMRDIYFEKNVRSGIGDKQLREIFDRQIKKFKPVQEVRARHILVKKEEEALDMVERLNRGEEIATLAREHSQGPSGRNGGDLGYFAKGQKDKNFEEMAFSLERGEISAPIKSSFGWHIIKVEDKRMTKAPTFEELKDQIKGQLVQVRSRKLTADLRKAAKVEVLDKVLAAKFNAIQ